MNEFLEAVGILIALGSITSVVAIFSLFMRAIGRKEREALKQYHQGDYHE
ncbi:MAG: hypothetical protein ACPG8W_05855 [Candidatus Promineifilaceae bacterium]